MNSLIAGNRLNAYIQHQTLMDRQRLAFLPARTPPHKTGRSPLSLITPSSTLSRIAPPLNTPARLNTARLFSRSTNAHLSPSVESNDQNRLQDGVHTENLPKGSLLISPKRPSKNQQQSAIVLLPGTDIAPSQYRALAETIQDTSEQSVWVCIPSSPFKTANPISTQSLTDKSIKALKQAGYQGDKIFLAGHSLAGIFLPSIIPDDPEKNSVAGMILLGSYTLRSERKKDNLASTIPTLTLSGDLDGLIRVGRIAEDMYHHITKQGSTDESKLQHAVVVVEGMNHMQFATGRVPPTVQANDLKPEISEEHARTQVAETISEFLATHQTGPHQRDNNKAQQAILSKVNETETFLNPIIKAMQLEGSYHLHPPCHLSEEGEECTIGSKWSEVAQAGLAHVDSAELDAHDEFHQTWYINFFPKEGEPHFYHPHIDPNSSSHTQPLNVTTVTEAVYEKLDTFDNPLVSNMAKELRIKFNSRQAILKGLGIDRPFPESEIPNICSKLNAQTIKWALAKAPERVRNRYLDHGVKLVAGRDIEHNNGPAWIWSYLEYNLEEQSEGNMQRVLDSHTMKTALDHPIPASDGKHYCKLLSPAKAMDWIYTDALREQKSDKKGC